MYDHLLFDMPDMGAALDQVNEEGLKIISSFAIPESQQICMIVEKRNDLSQFKNFIGKGKDEKED